jgi:hypothetical protein
VCLADELVVVDAGILACRAICAALWFTNDCPNCWNNLHNSEDGLNNHCVAEFCCPISCGSNCCDLGVSCLSPASGLCCSGTETPCRGKTCCASDQVCMGDGSCCPTAAALMGLAVLRLESAILPAVATC